jgi:hypothetical protein
VTVTSTDVANQALQLIGGNQPAVTGVAPTFDDSTAGKALQTLYAPCVATIARQWEWDMARNVVSLTASGNTPPVGWAYEYVYPSNGIEVWQITPAEFTDPNDPLPTNWVVGNALKAGVQTKVIWTNVVNAQAVYNNNPTEDLWDAGFREAVVRLLASELALALFGKPDVGDFYLENAGKFLSSAEARDS